MKQHLWLTLVTCLAYCLDKELWKAIDYLKEQVRVLKEQQEKDKRILLNDPQRIRLAAKAKRLTRELLEATTVLFTPETILGWYRKLIAQKYDGSENCKNPGRPRISQEITDLVIRFKEENPHWGYTRIRDFIVHLGYKIGETTVKNILLEHGYDPEPDLTRKTTWKEFLSSHWNVLAACDSFSVELLIKGKLIRCMVFFAIELSTRKVEILGIRPQPNGPWMEQIARNATGDEALPLLFANGFGSHADQPLGKVNIIVGQAQRFLAAQSRINVSGDHRPDHRQLCQCIKLMSDLFRSQEADLRGRLFLLVHSLHRIGVPRIAGTKTMVLDAIREQLGERLPRQIRRLGGPSVLLYTSAQESVDRLRSDIFKQRRLDMLVGVFVMSAGGGPSPEDRSGRTKLQALTYRSKEHL